MRYCFLIKNGISYGVIAIFSFFINPVKAQPIHSPDGKIRFYYNIDKVDDSKLKYHIDYLDKEVILPSELGLTNWYEGVTIVKVIDTSINENWNTIYGERSFVNNQYNQRIIILKNSDDSRRHLWIVVRIYNQGVAFRYFFSEDTLTGGGHVLIKEEKTTFEVPENTQCWFAPYAQAQYQKLHVDNWPGQAERPLTLELPNGIFACIGEAALVTHSRMKFYTAKNEKNIIRCALYKSVENMGPYATPWRFVMVAQRPGELLENNDFILNLNEPNKISNTSWIKPGKIMRVNTFTTAFAKEVVDFAAKHNMQYIHFDAGWYGKETFIESDPRKVFSKELDLPEVVAYAKAKGIGVWLYVNQRALTKYLDEILPLYKKWGIAGIKFGFVLVGSQHWTTWLHEAVSKCAAFNLMVDIHDEYRPTGFSRTYPNLLTQEGVRGNEEFPDANLNCTLPFTRYVAGAADYTICYYSRRSLKPGLKNAPENKVLKNTSGHQLALSVINYSPLQFLFWYDNPSDYQGEPEIEFFDQLQTVWDESIVINGEIGEHISMARRSNNKWFVGTITNNEARSVDIPLYFLNPHKRYKLSIYEDGGESVPTRTHVKISRIIVNSKDVVKVKLPPRGGCAMIAEEL